MGIQLRTEQRHRLGERCADHRSGTARGAVRKTRNQRNVMSKASKASYISSQDGGKISKTVKQPHLTKIQEQHAKNDQFLK